MTTFSSSQTTKMSSDLVKTSNHQSTIRNHGKSTVPAPSSSSNSARTSISASSTPFRTQSSAPPSPELLQQDEFPEEISMGTLELPLPTSPMVPIPASPGFFEQTRLSKGPGLMRRISRGAQNKLRARASTSNLRMRERSSGPTVLRQRSESKTFTDASHEVSDLDLDDMESLNLESPRSRPEDLVAPIPSPARVKRKYFGPDGKILVPTMLLEGTQFTKITRKKKHPLLLKLDCDGNNKIFWSHLGSNSKRQIYVDDIKEIRTDDQISDYLDEFDMPASLSSLWLTIIYVDAERGKPNNPKTKHLIAPDANSCSEWRDFLIFLMKHRGDLMVGMGGNDEEIQKRFWDLKMNKRFGNGPRSEADEYVDFDEVRNYCHDLAIHKSDKDLREQWDQVDILRTGRLYHSQYKDFFRSVTYRKDIAQIFEKIKPSSSCTKLTATSFFNFLQQYQGIDFSQDRERWYNIFEKFTTAKDGTRTPASFDSFERDQIGMDLEAFQDFLLSDQNSALERSVGEPKLDRPLNEYFISSSHNTYLSGRQIYGDSTADRYTTALKAGCRCVEIDCWDGDDGKPKVTHGNTFTTRISFLECIKTIDKHAFDASPYPLIISLEVHCNATQQKLMAEIMKEHFGSKLLLAPLQGVDSNTLPSPEQLKGRILIKVKKPQAENTGLVVVEPPNTTRHKRQRSKSEVSTASTRKMPPPLPPIETAPNSPQIFEKSAESPMSQPFGSTNVSVPGSSSEEEDLDLLAVAKKAKQKTSNIIPELGKLGVYVRGIKFGDFKASESKTYNHIFSFTESTFEDRCKTPELKRLMEKHNSKYLMRVYPKGSRVTSTNPNPLQFWRRGVQMVATNWQTADVGTQINNAMFAAGHDKTGYVLKPIEMRSRLNEENDLDRFQKRTRHIVQFSVDIISANRLQAPAILGLDAAINPYIEIEIFSADDKAKGIATAEGGTDLSDPTGSSGLDCPKRKRTNIIQRNGYNPIFKQPIKVALATKYASLVFVRLTVWHSPDGRSPTTSRDPIGTYTAKLSSLQQGYRQIHLFNKHQEKLISTLLLYIHKEKDQDLNTTPYPVPDEVKESKTPEEYGSRGGKSVLRRILSRTPSGRRRMKDNDGEYFFSRSTSMEK